MLKLLRRQMEWLLGLGLLMIVVYHLALSSNARVDIFQLPQGRVLKDLFFCLAGAGLSLGLFVGLYDEMTSTREFIRHRPLSTRRLYFMEHAASALLLLIGFGITLFVRRFFIADRGGHWGGYYTVCLDDPVRWLSLFSLSTLAWASYAIGVFTTQAPGNRFLRLLQGAVLMTAWTFLSYCFMENHWRLSVPAFAILQILLCLYLLTLGAWNVARSEDQDLPMSTRCLVANAIPVGLAALFSLGILVTEMQSSAIADLKSTWPGIQVQDDDFFLVTPSRFDRKSKIVNAQHSADGVDQSPLNSDRRSRFKLADPRQTTNAIGGRFLPGPRSFGLGPVIAPTDFLSNWWLDHEQGVLRRFKQEWASDVRMTQQQAAVLQRDDGKPFSWSTKVKVARDARVHLSSGMEMLILDPEEGRVWGVTAPKLDREDSLARIRALNEAPVEPILVPLPLPDGDLAFDLEISMAQRGAEETTGRFLITGKRAQYEVKDGVVLKTDYESKRFQYSVAIDDREHLAPEFVVHDLAGKEVFRHRYGLFTSEEKWAAAPVIAASFLRAPLSLLASLAAPDLPVFGYKEDRVVLDPLVAGGRRFWLVAAVLILGAVLALGQDWRLRRMHAAKACRRFWFIAIFLGGPALFILGVFMERPRRHAALPQLEPKTYLLKSA